jgi:hypothetical protein
MGFALAASSSSTTTLELQSSSVVSSNSFLRPGLRLLLLPWSILSISLSLSRIRVKFTTCCCYEQVTKQSLSLQITKLKISESRINLKHMVQISVEERAHTVNMQSLLPEI